MMHSQLAFATAFAFAFTPSFAETVYMSDPGLCDAPDGVTELLDTTFLFSRSMGNHYFDCNWDRDLDQLLQDGWPAVNATCANGTETWMQELKFYPQDESNLDYPLQYPIYLSVWFDPREMMPVKFYRCDRD